MIRKPLVRWSLTVILGLFLLLNLQQGLGTLLSGEDWSGTYVSVEGTLVDSVETERPGSTRDKIDNVSCLPILEIEVDGVKHRVEAIWWTQRYKRTRGPDCMEQAYGEKLPVLMSSNAPTLMFFDPDNPPTAEGTSFTNLGIAAFMLVLLWFLWRPQSSER